MSKGNVLVIGGSAGIGLEVVRQLLDEGYDVETASRNFSSDLRLLSVNHHLYDVNDPSAKLPFFDNLKSLVYCPGSIQLRPFHTLKREAFESDLSINLLGFIQALQQVLPALKANGKASVVAFSTVAVQTGMPFHASIAAAKGAMEGLFRSLAAEYAQTGIRFNLVAPSLTRTQLASKLISTPEREEASAKRHPLPRIGEPYDMASAALFLLSERSSWITGQVIPVDGGMSNLRTN